MSDFIFCSQNQDKSKLVDSITDFYQQFHPELYEYQGAYGSLAISRNLYEGFDPYVSEENICFVIGGPLLNYENNSFITGRDKTEGTRSIYERWIQKNKMVWEEDLSGPFVVGCLNKQNGELKLVTDLMSFIPVYKYQNDGIFILGTHVDSVAAVARSQEEIDKVSIADFIVNGMITFPYTFYREVFQLYPGSIYTINKNKKNKSTYWKPTEEKKFSSLSKAAQKLHISLLNYVAKVTSDKKQVGLLLSGGEDSRVVLGALSQCSRDNGVKSFIFLDSLNREGRIGKKAAKSYDSELNIGFRSFFHYLDVLPACSDLVGAGNKYFDVHSYGFHKKFKLENYDAIFGGMLSDALIKGSYIKKKYKSRKKILFVPEFKGTSTLSPPRIQESFITSEVMERIHQRREMHCNKIKDFRPKSFDEWFNFWPSSQDTDMSYVYGNRRLFKNYEPFLSSEIVKLSSAVPQNWKLNRRIFLTAFKKLLQPSKFLPHGEGRLPYFPWYINIFVQSSIRFWWALQRRLMTDHTYQGPWTNLKKLTSSDRMGEKIKEYKHGFKYIDDIFKNSSYQKLFGKDMLKEMEKLRLLQVFYTLKRNFNESNHAQ